MNNHIDLVVREMRPETSEAVCMEFEIPEGGIDYLPGQYITLIATINGKEVRRPYSLCSSPTLDEYPAVGIKRVKGGLMSNYVNDNVKKGDTLHALLPMGNFTAPTAHNHSRHVILLGGGSGITPLLGIAKTILAEEPDSHVSLVYANQHEHAIMFKSAWDTLKEQHADRLTVVYTLDTASPDWNGPTGMLTTPKLVDIIKQLPDRGVFATEYFVCGPGGLMHAIFAALDTLGVPKDRVKKEVFSNNKLDTNTTETMSDNAQNPDALVEDDTKAYEVTIILDGEEHTFTVEPGYSILETGLDEGIDMPYSCQSGLCTACRGKLQSGKVTMEETEGLSDEEMEEGYVLNCVGHPVTPGVRIEIG